MMFFISFRAFCFSSFFSLPDSLLLSSEASLLAFRSDAQVAFRKQFCFSILKWNCKIVLLSRFKPIRSQTMVRSFGATERKKKKRTSVADTSFVTFYDLRVYSTLFFLIATPTLRLHNIQSPHALKCVHFFLCFFSSFFFFLFRLITEAHFSHGDNQRGRKQKNAAALLVGIAPRYYDGGGVGEGHPERGHHCCRRLRLLRLPF